MDDKSERQYVNVSFQIKDAAKKLGARWDPERQLWFIRGDHDKGQFYRQLKAATDPEDGIARPRCILNLPNVSDEFFEQRTADLRAAGAIYDRASKSWSVSKESDLKRIRKWLAREQRARQYQPGADEIGRYLRYCDDALQQADLDKIVGDKALKATNTDFVQGRLQKPPPTDFLEEAPPIAQCLLKVALSLEIAHPEHDEFAPDDEADEPVGAPVVENAQPEPQLPPISDMRAVFVAFGFPWKRGEKRGWKVLLAVPAALSTSGTLFPVYGQMPLFNLEFFEPQPKKRKPILGHVNHLEKVLATTREFAGSSWREYVDWINEIFSNATSSIAAGNCDVADFKDNELPFAVTVTPYTRKDSMVAALHDLYVAASGAEPAQIPLLHALYSGGGSNEQLSNEALRRTAIKNTGHMGGQFGLDPSQRLALRHLLETPPGHTLAVSGPPGTGKTSMMQSVIATEVVNSVLDSVPQAPLIIASSATNQAVTNIIKAFASIGAPFGDLELEARWIPDVPSYGWYFPSRSKADSSDAAEFQQLVRDREQNSWRYSGTATSFQQNLDARSDLTGLRGQYLERFRAVFQQTGTTSIEKATSYLRQKLHELVASDDAASLKQLLRKCESLDRLIVAAPLLKRLSAKRALENYEKRMSRVERYESVLQSRVSTANEAVWVSPSESHLSSPVLALFEPKMRPVLIGALVVSMLTAIVAGFTKNLPLASALAAFWISASVVMLRLTGRGPSLVRKEPSALKEARRAAQQRLDRFYRRKSLLSTPPPGRDLLPGIDEIEAVNSHLEGIAREFLSQEAARAWTAGFGCGITNGMLIDDNDDFKQGHAIGHAISHGPKQQTLSDMLEAFMDRTIRVRCFHLAARYWEGRWLAEADNPIDGEDETAVMSALRRHCMLAPVVVATANTLPNLLRLPGVDENPDTFAFAAADLLIIDEAGQVAPPVAVALFALAKRCVTVGDVHQLAPIVTMSKSQDRSLLRLHGFENTITKINVRGLTTVGGSIMKAALSASYFGGTENSITLLRHYRCRPTIIEFCNELLYNRIEPLIPMIREEERPLYHPMSYVELDYASKPGDSGSRENDQEAKELVEWLKSQREAIEAHYNREDDKPLSPQDPKYRDLRKLVAIITPYAAQKQKITTLVRTAFQFDTADEDASERERETKMVIGTVHALQGAERPIVIFSSVSAPKEGQSAFIDVSADMLNVAVSRAKDTFILFGNKDLFFSKRAMTKSNLLPSATLGRYMRRFGRHLYPRTLVVVESEHKAPTVQAALGRSCKVVGTVGHVRDIAQTDFSEMKPTWTMKSDREQIVAQITAELDDMEELVLATDDDREGDAIAWHVLDELQHRRPLDGIRISRMVFHEVTTEAIRTGYEARTFPWNGSARADAASTRALIDKEIGISLSKTLADAMHAGGDAGQHSMGRVKAALLELIEREQAFSDRPWSVTAAIQSDETVLHAFLVESPLAFEPQEFDASNDAEAVCAELHGAVVDAAVTDVTRFTLGAAESSSTAEVLIRAYEELDGMMPQKTQTLLQHLYEGRRG